jgi:hypothetical protein
MNSKINQARHDIHNIVTFGNEEITKKEDTQKIKKPKIKNYTRNTIQANELKDKIETINLPLEEGLEQLYIYNKKGQLQGKITYNSEQEKWILTEPTKQKKTEKKEEEAQEREKELKRIERENFLKESEEKTNSGSVTFKNKKKNQEIEL